MKNKYFSLAGWLKNIFQPLKKMPMRLLFQRPVSSLMRSRAPSSVLGCFPDSLCKYLRELPDHAHKEIQHRVLQELDHSLKSMYPCSGFLRLNIFAFQHFFIFKTQ